MKGRAIRFLFGTALAWAGVRAILLWPNWSPPAPRAPIRWAPPLLPVVQAGAPQPLRARPVLIAAARARMPGSPEPVEVTAEPQAPTDPPPDAAAPPEETAAPFAPLPTRRRRVAMSGWLLVRPDAARGGLAAAGQLGGSQVGVRATLPLSGELALAGRLSAPLSGTAGREAAIGLDWRAGALTLAVERRVGLAPGQPDRWAVLAFGGANARVAPELALEAYGQAGMVGARRPQAFADGAAILSRRVGAHGFAGAGAWAGTQPGAMRVDIGPTLGVRFGRKRLSLDGRARIAGRARPGSGLALTLGADF